MNSETETINQDYSGLSVELTRGSRRKQKLSNHLELTLKDDRSTSSIRLTIRQAKALREFLTKNLD